MRCSSLIAVIVTLASAAQISADSHCTSLAKLVLATANASPISRTLYAVNQSSAIRGSISVYDIDHEHNLLKTIPTVSNVDNVKGVAVSAATGKLYVAYLRYSTYDVLTAQPTLSAIMKHFMSGAPLITPGSAPSRVGMIYCFEHLR
jgi:DNA-binding beta-propeller fold protein YncE